MALANKSTNKQFKHPRRTLYFVAASIVVFLFYLAIGPLNSGDTGVPRRVERLVLAMGILAIVTGAWFARSSQNRKAEQEQVNKSEPPEWLWGSIIQSAQEGIVVFDGQGRSIVWNKSLVKMLGLHSESPLRNMPQFIFHLLGWVRDKDAFSKGVQSLAGSNMGEIAFVSEGGQSFTLHSHVHCAGPEILGRVWRLHAEFAAPAILEGREPEKQRLVKLEKNVVVSNRQSFHDTLTGLANRALFVRRVTRLVRRAERHHGYAVLFLELDGYNRVKAELGNAAGDDLLVGVADRLLNCIRPEDLFARLGDNQFAILLEGIDSIGQATIVSERIREHLKQPFSVIGETRYSSVYLGIVLGPSRYLAAEDVLRDAEAALMRAKNKAKDVA